VAARLSRIMTTILIADPEGPLDLYAEERAVAATFGADLVMSSEIPPRIHDAEVLLIAALAVPGDIMPALARCRLIVRYGIGVDTIDIEAATAHGIVVANAPTFCVDEVADHTAGLILSLARGIPWLDRQVRAGAWVAAGDSIWGVRRLSTLTLGILGLGRIGRQVVRRMTPFGFRILCHDPQLSSSTIEALGVTPVSFEELLRTADILSMHVPLMPSTRHLINASALALMKPTAILINTGRGGLVDEAALIRALQEQRLHGVALDVLEREPPAPDNPLLAMDLQRVILTPHFAASSADAEVQLHREVAAAVASLLAGRWPEATVNPQAVPKVPLAAPL
jgi:D-3-phosphoglycerate dehydrogenase